MFICSCIKKNDAGVLCNGNGSTAYKPMALGDSWHFEADSVANASYDTVVGQSGSMYYIRNFLPSNITYTDTFCVMSNGDVYIMNAFFGSKHLLVPANPAVGEKWTYTDTSGFIYTDSVLTTTASVLTFNCLYSNCLAIRDSANDNLVNVVYYAKGVGVVESDILNNGSIISSAQLSSVSLH